MKSYEYIEEVRRIKGLDTDYKAAKMLGWGQNKITQYKNGQTMDNEAARQIAEILDIPVLAIIADMEAQRAKDDATRNKWIQLAKMTAQQGLASTNLMILLGFLSGAVKYCILC